MRLLTKISDSLKKIRIRKELLNLIELCDLIANYRDTHENIEVQCKREYEGNHLWRFFFFYTRFDGEQIRLYCRVIRNDSHKSTLYDAVLDEFFGKNKNSCC